MKWNKGAPPHIGWFLTRVESGRPINLWRWFDGESWSLGCSEVEDHKFAGDYALNTAGSWLIGSIIWSDYYPKNARVPRINPNKKVKK